MRQERAKSLRSEPQKCKSLSFVEVPFRPRTVINARADQGNGIKS